MTLLKPKPTNARERGSWPEVPTDIGFEDPVAVTIVMEREIYQWLADFVAASDNPYFCTVEEAITTSTRAMMGPSQPRGLDSNSYRLSVMQETVMKALNHLAEGDMK